MTPTQQHEEDTHLLRVIQFRAGSAHAAIRRINEAQLSRDDMQSAESSYDYTVQLLLRACEDLPGRLQWMARQDPLVDRVVAKGHADALITAESNSIGVPYMPEHLVVTTDNTCAIHLAMIQSSMPKWLVCHRVRLLQRWCTRLSHPRES